MSKGRFEAFTDAVLAIVMTIMVLEMKVPHGTSIETLIPIWPVFASYVLSFIFLGIYWNNHHHMLHTVRSVNGPILWANLHLLFWLSLVPFATGWMGENQFANGPVALYGIVLFMAGCAYFILATCLRRHHGPDSQIARALGNDVKGKISVLVYAVAVALAQWVPAVSVVLYAIVAIGWLVPDRRMERVLREG